MRLPSLAAGALAALALQAAHAQTDSVTLPEVQVSADAEGPSTEGTGLYTAREINAGKLVQSPRETPQSLSVITRQQLDERNITKLEDAAKFTTGVTVSRFDGAGNYNTIQSRGFDIGAIQYDGMAFPQGANFATALDTAIYDRIEVLRGPSGLLQGASEPGGTINLVRKRARSQLGLSAGVAVGSWNQRRAEVDLTGPLNASGSLRGRLVLVNDDRHSYVATLRNDKTAGYGTLELDIAAGTTLSVGRTQQCIGATVDQGLPGYADGRLIDLPRSTFAGLARNRQDLETTDTFAELEHRLDNGGLLKLAARQMQRDGYYSSARANGSADANGDYTMETVDFLQDNANRNVDLYLATPVQLQGRSHRLLLGA
ncbi:MAG: TonB-dependent siderophore receptor, partial [Comamonas sp.]